MARLDSETLTLLLTTLKDYAERRLGSDYLLELDSSDQFPAQVLAELNDPATLGLHLLSVPQEYGGLGAGAYDIYRVSEALARIDLGIATGVLATFLGFDPISVGGTPEQKSQWMKRLVDTGCLIACGATEPQAGSDLAALSTQAVPVRANGSAEGYRITGRKQWISNGGVAEVCTILANAPGGPSWFIVERGAEGFSHGKPEQKHGIRSSNTAALFLENVFVPRDRLVGGVEGLGLAQAQAVFGYTRLMVAAFGLGAGWAALQRSVRYSQQRVQGGTPLSQKQAFTHKLIVPNAVRLEAARAYIESTADRLDGGEADLATEGAVAKLVATEAGNRAAEDAIQALGGYGYTRDYLVEKIKRDVRITTIYEGTSEILEWTIARDRWQRHLKTKGQYYADWADRLEARSAALADTGGAAATLALRSLGALLERCRLDRLTRNQHVLFRLGELIASAETAAAFCERAALGPSPASGLGPSLAQALARLSARDAAQRVATEGMRWANGAGQTDPDLMQSLHVGPALAAQAGLIQDMDVAAQELAKTFPAA